MPIEAKGALRLRWTGNKKKLSYSPRVSLASKVSCLLSWLYIAPIAQLDRVPPSEGGGHTFESCWARHKEIIPSSIIPQEIAGPVPSFGIGSSDLDPCSQLKNAVGG